MSAKKVWRGTLTRTERRTFEQAWGRISQTCYTPENYKLRTINRMRDALKFYGQMTGMRAKNLAKQLWKLGFVCG